MKAFHKRITLRVIKRREDRLDTHVQRQTNHFANHTRVFVATAETAFVVHLEICRKPHLLPGVQNELNGIHGTLLSALLACRIA